MAALSRAPKNCICLPTAMGETQQAMAVSSPQWQRISESDSYCSALVSIEISEQKSLYPCGSAASQ